MGVINVLDKHTAELIAAGEVVERPSSVIKELVENSIDAGAKNITVEIKNGGTTFMRVTDDGCGIYKDDIKIAFLRHATSKVKTEIDLEKISTLGFRGEALASISAVSRLQLLTKNVNEEIGNCYKIDGGEEVSFEPAGCPSGTTFVIRDLFYNIPARSKFLKKDVSEGNAVSAVMDRVALSHPEISFTYIRDGKQVLKTFGDGKLLSAIYSVFGKDFAKGLIPVDYELDTIKVYGYISKPINARATRNMQTFFINGRFVKTRTGMAALEEACKGSVMVGKFPACVLQITLPYEIIDVNVHPAKVEVRFINERPVFDAIYHAVKSALAKGDERNNITLKNNSAFNDIKKVNPFYNAEVILNKTQDNIKNNIKTNDINSIYKNTNYSQKTNSNIDTDTKKDLKNNFNPFDEVDLPTQKIQKSENLFVDDTNVDSLNFSDVIENPFDIFSKTAINKEKKVDFKKNEYIKNDSILKSMLNLETANENIEKVSENDNVIVDENGEKNISNNDKSIETDINIGDKLENCKNSQNIIINDNSDEITIIPNDKFNLKYVGELFDTYIIVEKNNKEILLIDKHAAHERMIYEQLKNDAFAQNTQMLLQPVTVILDKNEYDAAVNNLDMFAKCCFEVDDFGNGVLIVRSAPQYIDISEISDCISEMSSHILLGKKDIYTEKMDWFYHNVACRSAIKAGNKSTVKELMDIVKKLEENDQLKYCPHGRPICYVMTKYELEKQFGRV